MYHTEPPTDKTIREWYMNFSRVAACSFRSAVSVLVVAQSSSEIPEGLMNNSVLRCNSHTAFCTDKSAR